LLLLALLLGLELLNNSEVETNDVLGKEDIIIFISDCSSYMRRNLNGVFD